MISKKYFPTDGTTTNFLSEFIIKNDDYCRVYVSNTVELPISEVERQALLANNSEWELVNNNIVFYEPPAANQYVTVWVASTPEELDSYIDYAFLTYDNIQNIETVVDNLAKVNTVHTNIDAITTVDTNIADIVRVKQSIGQVERVNTSIDNIDRVDLSIDKIDRVYDSIDAVDRVNTSISSVEIVNTNIADVDTVANSIANVNTTANNIAHVQTNSDNITDIKINSLNIADVLTVANNINSVNLTAQDIESVKSLVNYIVGGFFDASAGTQFLGSAPVKGIQFMAKSTNEVINVNGSTNAFSVGDFTVEDGGYLVIQDGATYKIL